MASYYYLMSSLPLLKSDGSMPIKYSEFLDMCKGEVSKSKYDLLENLTVNSNEGPFLSEWAKFYGTLSRELNHGRKAKLKITDNEYKERDESVAKIVNSVMNEKNPLVAEKILLSMEFEKLDELIGIHNFDDWSLFGYALKLKLLERQSIFDFKKGKREYNVIIDSINEKILSIG